MLLFRVAWAGSYGFKSRVAGRDSNCFGILSVPTSAPHGFQVSVAKSNRAYVNERSSEIINIIINTHRELGIEWDFASGRPHQEPAINFTL